MNTKSIILKEVQLKGSVRSAEMVRKTGISRQTIAQHFRDLIKERKLIKLGSTHNASYIPYASSAPAPLSLSQSAKRARNQTAILLIHCPDKKGIVSEVTKFLFQFRGNILYLDQHVDFEKKVFFMRVEWDLNGFLITRKNIGHQFDQTVGRHFHMKWQLSFSDEAPRMAIFVSKLPHCLYDILARCQSGEWNVEVPLIISNHEDLRPVAEQFGIEFHYFPVTKTNKKEQEKLEIELLKKYGVDFLVLARYMQILSDSFIHQFPERVINIHHSFLPAFPGSKPYHSAYERGVKIIGATSHYVTEKLDEGPIIEQDTARVSHKDTVEDLIRKGRDLEKLVLARAIWHHIRRTLLVHENRTVNFS